MGLKKVRQLIVSLCAMATAVAIVGCLIDDSAVGADSHEESFAIAMANPGHLHAFHEYTLSFTVTEDGKGEAGVDPVILRQLEGDTTVSSTKTGDITDAGNGTYTWKRSFNEIGVYLLTFQFVHDADTFSNCFMVEVSKAGGERIYCPDSTNPTRVYQVRWTADPAHIHAGDTATFEIELKRSINTTVNTAQPWANSFDHLNPADFVPADSLPLIMVGSAGGEDTVAVTYKGQGIYSVKNVFSHVTEKTTYWLHVKFTDSCGTVDVGSATETDYQVSVSPGH